MAKVIPSASVEALTRTLEGSACFTRVERGEVRHELAEVEFSVDLSPGLAQPFEEGVRDLGAARRDRPADNELAAVLEALLVARLDLEEFEVELEEDVDPDDPVLPETVTLVVRVPAAKKTRKRKKTKNSKTPLRTKNETKKKAKRTRPDFSKMSETERRVAVEREQERLRSQRRREAKRKPGVRMGRPGYVEKGFDPSRGREVWRPTKLGTALMRELGRVWEKTITDRATLLAHLREKGLKTLSGRIITRNMLTDLLTHLHRLRLDAK